MKLNNYLDLLVDEKIDGKTNCPICIDGISDILTEIYWDLKNNIGEGKFQKFMREKSLKGIYHWKRNWYPVPIEKVRKLLLVWKESCKKSREEYNDLYERIYQKATRFKAKSSPVNIKIVRSIDANLAYLLGIIYADGALRNIWLTFENEKRFRWEITITDESSENLGAVVSLLEEVFGIKTNVKTVYGGKWYRILFQSMILLRLLSTVFGMPLGYKKGKLRIPEIIKNAPFEIKKHFVIGFFDGDGWCSIFNRKKRFTPALATNQSSREILDDLNEILKEAGLNFHINTARRHPQVWYTLVTKDKNQIKKFREKFGFNYPNKKERLRVLVESFDKTKATTSLGSSAYRADTFPSQNLGCGQRRIVAHNGLSS